MKNSGLAGDGSSQPPRSLAALHFVGNVFTTICPTHGSIELSGFYQALDVIDAEIAAFVEVFKGETGGLVGVVKLFGAFASVPSGLVGGKDAAEFVAIDAIAALVGTTVYGVLDAAPRDGFTDDFGKLADAVVLLGDADVENFVVNEVERRIENGQDGGGNVANVNDGTPGRAVTFYVNAAGGVGPGDEIVKNDVQAESRGNAIGGGAAEISGREIFVGERSEIAFDEDFRFGVSGDGIEDGRFIVHGFAAGTVGAAGRKKDEAAHACGLAELGETHGSQVIDLVGELRIEITERIVGERSEMNDGVETCQVGEGKIAHVLADAGNFFGGRSKITSGEEIGIEADDIVPRGLHEGASYGTDVAFMASKENFHTRPF